MAAFALILIALFVLLIIYLCKFYTPPPKNFPPGPPRLPIWGAYWFLLKENYFLMHIGAETLAKHYKTNVLGMYLGTTPAIFTSGYEMCKEVLIREEFSGRNDTIVTRGRSFGELIGIFFVNGPYWKEQRRFSLRHLRDYGFGRRFASTEELFEREVRDLIELFTSNPKPDDYDVCRKKGQIYMPDIFYAPMLNSILFMLLAKRFDNHKELREIARAILRFLQCSDGVGGALCITPWLRFIAPGYFGYTPVIQTNTRLRDFIQEQISERKITFSDDHHADFTDVYFSKMKELEKENEFNTTFSEKQLLWTLIDYMFPAPVAVGNSLSCLWACLLHYPHVQTKLHEEIDTVVGRNRLPTLDDRINMPYAEAVIREALRIHPITPLGVPRRCTEDTTLGGYFIPKDTSVLPSIWSAHHDPKVWGDPENFRPERFLDDKGKLLKKDYTLGFGAGKRLCAGETFARQSMFLLLSGLMQNFTFTPVGDLPDLDSKVWGILMSVPGFWINAVSR